MTMFSLLHTILSCPNTAGGLALAGPRLSALWEAAMVIQVEASECVEIRALLISSSNGKYTVNYSVSGASQLVQDSIYQQLFRTFHHSLIPSNGLKPFHQQVGEKSGDRLFE